MYLRIINITSYKCSLYILLLTRLQQKCTRMSVKLCQHTAVCIHMLQWYVLWGKGVITREKKLNTILWQQKLSWYLTQIDWWFTGLSFSDYFKEHQILNILVLCLLSSFLSFRMWMSPHSWTKDKYAFPQRQEMKVICEKPRKSVLKIQICNLLIINLKCIFIVPFIKTCYKDVLIWNLIME